MKKKQVTRILKNENGSVLLIAVLILIALTLIGISAISTSDMDIRISANDKFHKMAFFAADAGVSYVLRLPAADLPDPGMVAPFPGTTPTYLLSDQLEFNGIVRYINKTNMPAGSGYSAGEVFAHNFQLVSDSAGTGNGTGSVHAGFYLPGK